MMTSAIECRFFAMVDKGHEGCWVWTGAVHDKRGVFHLAGGTVQAQRFAWEMARGPLSKGRRLLQTCETPLCISPDHWAERTSEEHFWSRVDKNPTYWETSAPGLACCWVWNGPRHFSGYGKFRPFRTEAGKVSPVIWAHRYSYELTHGTIPDGLIVCHRCDNPSCVRPDHLFLGTDADNSADMVRKGRSVRGEKQHFAKLTEADVLAIRRSRADARTVAARYGVTRTTIYAVRSRLIWKHV